MSCFALVIYNILANADQFQFFTTALSSSKNIILSFICLHPSLALPTTYSHNIMKSINCFASPRVVISPVNWNVFHNSQIQVPEPNGMKHVAPQTPPARRQRFSF